MYVCISANLEATSQASLSKSSVGYTPLFSTFACVWEWAHATPELDACLNAWYCLINWSSFSTKHALTIYQQGSFTRVPPRVGGGDRDLAASPLPLAMAPHRQHRAKGGVLQNQKCGKSWNSSPLGDVGFCMILLDIFDSRKRANISIFVMIFRPSKIPVQPKAMLQRGKQTILSVLDMLKVWSKAPLPSLLCLWRASASIGLNSSTNQSMPFSCP